MANGSSQTVDNRLGLCVRMAVTVFVTVRFRVIMRDGMAVNHAIAVIVRIEFFFMHGILPRFLLPDANLTRKMVGFQAPRGDSPLFLELLLPPDCQHLAGMCQIPHAVYHKKLRIGIVLEHAAQLPQIGAAFVPETKCLTQRVCLLLRLQSTDQRQFRTQEFKQCGPELRNDKLKTADLIEHRKRIPYRFPEETYSGVAKHLVVGARRKMAAVEKSLGRKTGNASC